MMKWIALAGTVLALAACPSPIEPAQCEVDGDCGADHHCVAGECRPIWEVCAPGVHATFSSINANVFQVSCAIPGGACHTPDGVAAGAGGTLDFVTDPYHALLGDGGTGAKAWNDCHTYLDTCVTDDLRRVVPGDAGASFLYIKLTTTSSLDPQYGAGMPLGFPASVCPVTLRAIRQWIEEGARDD